MDKLFEQMLWPRRHTNVKQIKRCSMLFDMGEIESQLQPDSTSLVLLLNEGAPNNNKHKSQSTV